MFKKNKRLAWGSVLLSLSINSYAEVCENQNLAVPATTDHLLVNNVNNQEIIDNKTGLVWQRCSVGQSWNGSSCNDSPTDMNWQAALSLAVEGWRLPNIKELSSIVERSCFEPAINTVAFPNTSNETYWSSSSYSRSSNSVWLVHFGVGYNTSDAKIFRKKARLVRNN